MRDFGPSMYPRLFWETGLIGQMLYLEAHAFGVSGTGIGCFFDDPGEFVAQSHAQIYLAFMNRFMAWEHRLEDKRLTVLRGM